MSTDARRAPLGHAWRFALLAGWCLLVWTLSDRSHPEDTVGWLMELPDWLLHGCEYAAGGFLARQALAPAAPGRGTFLAVVFCIAWGVLDELHQSFVPGRDPAVHDLFADIAGSLLGALLQERITRPRVP